MDKTDLRIAYILLVHKNPEQVNMFLRQLLTDEHADIYIHIDKKNMEVVSDKLIENPRIVKTSENVSVSWGDISIVDATIILLREVVKSGKNYDFVCLRSGQDMMVKNGYKEYLAENREKNFFSLWEIDIRSEYGAVFKLKFPKCTRKLYDSMHPYRILRSVLMKLYGLGINLFPNKEEFNSEIRLFSGSEWFCISMGMAKYMVDYLDNNLWFYQAFKDSLAPDTMFFNTLAMNSPFAKDIANKNQTYIKWGQTYKDNNHPVNLTTIDIREIEKTDCFFARKFDSSVDRKVMEYFVRKIVV